MQTEDQEFKIIATEGSNQVTLSPYEPKENELLMSERRPTPQHIAKSNGDGTGYWFDTTPCQLESCRITKLAEIRTECENQIVAGFISNALGYEVHYRCNRDDQMMMRDAKDNGGGLLWRNETLTAHTQTQAQDVFTAMIAHRDETCKVKYANKMNYLIEPSRTIEEIEAVTWSSN